MRHLLTLLTLLLGLCSALQASSTTQPIKGYLPGYVVLLNGDTLYGTIEDRNLGKIHETLYDRIRFVENGRKRARNYGPKNILGYKRGNEVFRVYWLYTPPSIGKMFTGFIYNIEGKGRREFMRVDHEGPLMILTSEFEDDDSSYLDEVSFFKLPHKDHIIKTSTLFGLQTRQIIKYLDGHCPALATALTNNKLQNHYEVVQYYTTHCVE